MFDVMPRGVVEVATGSRPGAECGVPCGAPPAKKSKAMPVYKRKYKSGAVDWSYVFDGPSAEGQRNQITESGFSSKKEATEAEAVRRIDEQQK
jgi:hypothetical protein